MTLTVQGIAKSFGAVQALDDVGLIAAEGTTTGLIGPNGAGKSTMLGVISGFITPDRGSVDFEGVELTRLDAGAVSRLGVVRTFQHATPLAGLDVVDNVQVGMHRAFRGKVLSALFGLPGSRRAERQARERTLQLLDDFDLLDVVDTDPTDLSFGKLRFLEIARAVAAEPRILLMDEPAAGLNRQETDQLADLLRAIQARGIGILLVDHDVPFVFAACSSITVMDFGRVIAAGTPDEMRDDDAVRAAYLNTEVVEEGVNP